jgi:hypothetical protein
MTLSLTGLGSQNETERVVRFGANHFIHNVRSSLAILP